MWVSRPSWVKVVVPVIAGMVFVRVERKEWVKVLEVRGVVSFLKLRGEREPAGLADSGLGGCSLCLFPAVFPGVGPGTMGNFPGAVGRRGIFGEKRKDFTSPLWPALEWSEEAVIPPQARFE